MNTLYSHRPHAFQLTWHDTPVLSPVRVSLELVPFDQSPSLHPLRDGWLFVINYYDRGGNHAPGLDPELRLLHLSETEKDDLLYFLRALDGNPS